MRRVLLSLSWSCEPVDCGPLLGPMSVRSVILGPPEPRRCVAPGLPAALVPSAGLVHEPGLFPWCFPRGRISFRYRRCHFVIAVAIVGLMPHRRWQLRRRVGSSLTFISRRPGVIRVEVQVVADRVGRGRWQGAAWCYSAFRSCYAGRRVRCASDAPGRWVLALGLLRAPTLFGGVLAPKWWAPVLTCRYPTVP
jgi:hypothetical protein